MKYILTILLFTYVLTTNAQTISKNSSVNFEIRNMGFNTVSGSFTEMNGTVNFDEKSATKSYFNVCINANTINTENKKRDQHLLKEDFFGTDQFPTICFESTNVNKTIGEYSATGNLTLHGITRSVELPFTFSDNTFTGEIKLKRSDFNLGPEGKFMIGNDVKISIKCIVE